MLKDDPKTIKEQWGIDPLEGVQLNEVQQILVDEALGNAKSTRTGKNVSMELENDYKDSFAECDKIIEKTFGVKKNEEAEDSLSDLEIKEENDKRLELKKKLLRNVYLNENPDWHSERNSLVHIKIVMSRAIETGDKDLIQAALYHDIAKFDEVSFNSGGWPTSQKHDSAGAALVSDPIVKYICAKHMVVKGWKGGTSETGELKDKTKFKIFADAPGNDNNEKAKAFWKLCVFTKMDKMYGKNEGKEKFDYEELKWSNPSYDKWDEECPLRDRFKKADLVQIIEEKPTPPFTSKELMKMGAKPGPDLGKMLAAITGKTPYQAKLILSDQFDLTVVDLTAEKLSNKSYIKMFEQFRNSRHKNKIVESLVEDDDVEVWDIVHDVIIGDSDCMDFKVSDLKEDDIILRVSVNSDNDHEWYKEEGSIKYQDEHSKNSKNIDEYKVVGIDLDEGWEKVVKDSKPTKIGSIKLYEIY